MRRRGLIVSRVRGASPRDLWDMLEGRRMETYPGASGPPRSPWGIARLQRAGVTGAGGTGLKGKGTRDISVAATNT